MTCQALPPNTPGYVPYCPFTLNGSLNGDPSLVKAQQLVDASGTKHVPITVWSLPEWAAVSRYVASVLGDLGYHVAVIPSDNRTQYFTYISDSSNRAQIGAVGWLMDFPEASNFFTPLVTCKAFIKDNPNNVNSNYAEYCNPKLDRKIEHASKVGATDPMRANRLWAEIRPAGGRRGAVGPVHHAVRHDPRVERVGTCSSTRRSGLLLGQMWVQ